VKANRVLRRIFGDGWGRRKRQDGGNFILRILIILLFNKY
jgi:hypothetical protein